MDNNNANGCRAIELVIPNVAKRQVGEDIFDYMQSTGLLRPYLVSKQIKYSVDDIDKLVRDIIDAHHAKALHGQ